MDIRQTDPGGLRQRLSQVLAARPLLRGLLRALGASGFCFVLAGAGLLDGPVPLALAPVCVLPFGPAAICAYLGAAAGYAVFWGLSAALEPVAAGFLLLAGSCLLADLVPDEQGWLASAAAGGIYALLGVIFVLRADGGLQAALQLILRLVLLTLSVRMLSPAPANARLRPYAAAVCLLAGLVRVQLPFGVPLGRDPGGGDLRAGRGRAGGAGRRRGLRAGIGSRQRAEPAADGLLLLFPARLPSRGGAEAGAGGGIFGDVFSVRARLGRRTRGLDARGGGRRAARLSPAAAAGASGSRSPGRRPGRPRPGGGRAARARGAGESGASGAADGPGPDL